MKYILAIDQGTTGSRAVVYDKKGRVAASAYQEFFQYFPRPGWVEHDPEEIWISVRNSINKVLSEINPADISAIGITNQRETTVVWDRATGNPVYNAIVWQCRRTAEYCDSLKKKYSAKIRKKTGLPIDAYFSASKIQWIIKNIAGDDSASSRSGACKDLCFGTTDSWILWKLTGGAVHATDYTNASRTMLFNINRMEWDEELLKLFKVPLSMMPEVRKSCSVFGKTVKLGRLPAGIPISGMAGDQQAALFGQACFTAGTMKNTYGTGAFMLLNTGRKRIESEYGLITTIGCGSRGEPVYVLEGAIFIAGAAVQWLRDGLKIIESAEDTQRMALSLRDNEGVYFVPALVGLGAPYWDQNARGTITGITRGTKPEHFVRAALEAMAYSSRDVLAAMQKDSGLKVKELKIDGGAVANDFLCQYQADMLGIDVIRPRIIESTSLGAAYLAGLAVGYWKNAAEISANWRKDKVFKAKMDMEDADLYYREWISAIKMVLKK